MRNISNLVSYGCVGLAIAAFGTNLVTYSIHNSEINKLNARIDCLEKTVKEFSEIQSALKLKRKGGNVIGEIIVEFPKERVKKSGGTIKDEHKKLIYDIRHAKKTYNLAYHDAYDTKIKVWTWQGKSSIRADQLTQTIKSVTQRLSFVPSTDEFISLLFETCCVESDGGRVVVQEKSGPARGIYQIEPATEKDTLEWLAKNKKDEYNQVMFFYDKTQDEEWNRRYNVPYQTAMASAIYWRTAGDNLSGYIKEPLMRACLWKAYYNTPLGKGTVDRYFASIKESENREKEREKSA